MADRVPTAEELKKLSPADRVKILRQIEEQRRKELEETRKQVEQEIAAAEELIKETEDETAEESVTAEEREKKKRDDERQEEEDLEERVRGERPAEPQEAGQYQTNLYTTLHQAADNLDRLRDKQRWDAEDRQRYNESKNQIARAQSYKLQSEVLEEELGLATGAFNRLKKYRR